MAVISMENPQDPAGDSRYVVLLPKKKHDQSKHESTSRKKKPSRALLYLRNRATASNLSMACAGLLLTVLSCHRVLSLYMTHRRWINAPITYMSRTCPAVASSYPVLNSSTAQRQRICITTLTDNRSTSWLQRALRWRDFDGILELTWPNKAAYAAKHGYTLVDGSAHINTSRPPAWSKIPAVRQLLKTTDDHHQSSERTCDWVVWTDADTVIMNSDISIEDFLPADPDKDLLVVADDRWGYNSGVFIFRNSDWSREFLDRWWNMRYFVRPPGFSLSGDNYAMKALLRDLPDFDQKVLAPSRCTFNSFAVFLTLSESMDIMDKLEDQEWYHSHNYYHKGDFIAHTPGYDNKAECLRLLLQEAR